MTWMFTGELKPDGRPIWKCEACGRKIWGHNVAPHHCQGPVPKRLRASEVPCRKRGLVYGKIDNSSCSCKETVYSCSMHAFCTINPVAGLVNNIQPKACRDCKNQE